MIFWLVENVVITKLEADFCMFFGIFISRSNDERKVACFFFRKDDLVKLIRAKLKQHLLPCFECCVY